MMVLAGFFLIFPPDFFVNMHILLILDPFSPPPPHPPNFRHYLVLVFLGDGKLGILLLLSLPASFALLLLCFH